MKIYLHPLISKMSGTLMHLDFVRHYSDFEVRMTVSDGDKGDNMWLNLYKGFLSNVTGNLTNFFKGTEVRVHCPLSCGNDSRDMNDEIGYQCMHTILLM